MILKNLNKLKLVNKIFRKFGFSLGIEEPLIRDDQEFQKILEYSDRYTMTTVERMFSLYSAVKYVNAAKIPGDIVECGVWKGGSMMLVAKTLQLLGETKRNIYLYDTYAGMSQPGRFDKVLRGNMDVSKEWEKDEEGEFNRWCYSSIEEVRNNMSTTGYPEKRIILVKGKVEETLKKKKHDQIAILRLDTDWYESTRVELEQLYPRLVRGGILILDDYGGWGGVKKAVDEYFSSKPVFLSRVDDICRVVIKT